MRNIEKVEMNKCALKRLKHRVRRYTDSPTFILTENPAQDAATVKVNTAIGKAERDGINRLAKDCRCGISNTFTRNGHTFFHIELPFKL